MKTFGYFKWLISYLIVVVSRPELKIRGDVLDWSSYNAAMPHLKLNISVANDPRLSKLKFGIHGKFLLIFFPPWLIRLIVLIVNSFFFETL